MGKLQSSRKIFSLHFGSYLKARREEANLSQLNVAKSLGYSSPQFISNIERGICLPPMPLLRKFIPLYGLDPREVTELLVDLQRNLLEAELMSSPKVRKSKVKARKVVSGR